MKFKEIFERDNVLRESINDKYLFKAVFLAGGPGSGKSFIAKKMFEGMPIMFINSDLPFEKLLNKNNLPMNIDKNDANMYDLQMIQRAKAKKIAKTKGEFWNDGMLPVVVDGTGKKYDSIVKSANKLVSLGYDVSMIFVNTSIEVARDRNLQRTRTVPDDILYNSWKAVQNNMGAFQSYFGNSNFYLIDNNDILDKKGVAELGKKLYKIGSKIIKSPLKNPIGNKIISTLKSTGGKYLSDLK